MVYRLSGQVTDGGDPVADQPVFVVDTSGSDPTEWTVEAADTTAADGSWAVTVAAADPERYHAVAQFDDGTDLKNAESLPFLTAQPVVETVAIDYQVDVLSPTISVRKPGYPVLQALDRESQIEAQLEDDE